LTDGDRARVIHACTALADRTAVSATEFQDAFSEVYSLARSAGDKPAEATALTGLGLHLLTDGAHDQAVGYLQQALTAAAEAGPYGRWMSRQALVFLATALSRLGRLTEARERARRAVEAAEHASDTLVLTIALHTLSIAEHGLGHSGVADDHLRRAVALCESTGDVDNLQHLLVTMASHELDRTDAERTVALLGAAEAMRRQAGAAVLSPHANPTAVAHLRDRTQQQLSHRLWRDSFATGLGLDVPGACRLALADP
jgi:tetratricopeptide (TPR) repeat protein